MKKMLFHGAATALVTPFKSDGSLDIYGLEQLINFQIENGIQAIVVSGTTGEGSTLSFDEFKLLVSSAVSFTNGRVPVIVGAGTNNTQRSIELSKEAEIRGADGLLLVTPFYNKTTQKGLISHFFKILEQTNLPAILYNVPSRTGLNISPETALELSQHPNVVGLKEASGNISQTMEIISKCKELSIYSGNDDLILPTLAVGGIGVISVLSNIAPQEVQRICTLFEQGKIDKAAKLQLNLLPLIQALFEEVNPIPIKYAMMLQNLPAGNPRLPLVPCGLNLQEKLLKLIKEARI